MFKRLVIVGCIWAAQTLVPAYREAVQSHHYGDVQPQYRANTSREPATLRLAAFARKTIYGGYSESASSKYEEQGQQSIIPVAEAPPTVWRYREWIAYGANLVLVLVGIGGVVAACYTLRFIKKQTSTLNDQANHMASQTLVLIETLKATQRSAEAADISARTAMGVAIPTLMLSEFSFGATGSADLAAIYQYPNLRIAVTNYGQSPAFLKEWTVIFHCGDLPRVPIYTHSYTYEMEEVLDAGKPHFLGGGSVRPRHFFSDSEVSQMVGNHRELHVYGYVVYGNVFDAKLRRLKFSKVLWAIHDNGTRAAFTDCGGDKFLGNDYPEDQRPNPN